MKVIENPVQTIEKAESLQKMAMQVGILMRSLENIFKTSNFYKEARMVSFLDRLLDCITQKIKKQCNLGTAIKKSCESQAAFKEEALEGAVMAITKFNENFFMR